MKVKTQAHLTKCFQTHWRHGYSISLCEFHHTSEDNFQQIKVGDGPWVNWRLAVVIKLFVDADGLTCVVEIHTSTSTTNQPIAKLFPLEVNSPTESTNCVSQGPRQTPVEETESAQSKNQNHAVRRWTLRQSAVKARTLMSGWAQTLCVPLEDVETKL